MKKMRIVGLLLTLVSSSLTAQFGDLVQGSKNDINYLVGGYASPFIKAFGSGLNQGWYNTAAPHKFPGVDLTISVSLITVPTSDRKYLVEDAKLEQLTLVELSNPNQAIVSANVPTMVGSDKDPQYGYRLGDGSVIDAPPGIFPIPKVPVPIAHLGIGLPKGTDLKIRLIPTVSFGDDLEIKMFGIGVMHDVKQWIPVVKNLPFSLSAFVGYTKFKTSVVFDPTQDQKGEFDISATTIQALVSKKLAVLTVYGGVGYDISNGGVKVKGSYDVDGSFPGPLLVDPVDITSSNSSMRATIGARLKLGPITFHGDYTTRKYNAITAGFGISVR
jgi:hypothetical protein